MTTLTPSSRLFSPYVQTEIGRRQGGKGSGLGLALVRQIVRLSNGRLGVDSEYGKGSVFWFELPYAIPPPSRKKTPMSIMGGASPHPSRPPLMTSAMAVPTIDEESMTSPAVEKDDPLDRIEHRGSDAMPLEPRPQGIPGLGQVGGQGQERPKLQETESTMPLLNRTPSGRIRRESGKSSQFIRISNHRSSLTIQSLNHIFSLIPHFTFTFLARQRADTLSSPNRNSHSNDLPTARLQLFKRLFL